MAGGRRLDGKPVPEAKTDYVKLFIAYTLLLVGGGVGLHLAYLGRQNQALVWSMTFGMFGFGFLRDAFTIPRYVREATGEERESYHQFLVRHLVMNDAETLPCRFIFDSAASSHKSATSKR